MKCPSCNTENKNNILRCKKCGVPMVFVWSPTWQWHAKVLGVIYVGLIILYFTLNWLLAPYLREIPPEVTPWLKKAQEIHK